MQVPADAFRLGRTRVFFRAGQISTLQNILNETGPDKADRIYSRLQEALANRHRAKAAAEEAKVWRPALAWALFHTLPALPRLACRLTCVCEEAC